MALCAALLASATGPSQGATVLVDVDTVAGLAEGTDYFGSAIALEADRMAVGASREADFVGAVYIFERGLDGRWNEVAKIEGESAIGSSFGASLALDGERLLVGAPFDNDAAQNAGAAHLYERAEDGSWNQIVKFTAPDAGDFDSFGEAVDLDGDRALIGTSGQDDPTFNNGAGYIFERDNGGTWRLVAKLQASESESHDQMGKAVALEGNVAILGAHAVGLAAPAGGAVYLFERHADGVWNQSAVLTAEDAAEGDFFGLAVALEGDRIAVGAREKGLLTGAVYVFERQSDQTWSQVTSLSPRSSEDFKRFGTTLALDGERLMVSSPLEDAAYVFDHVGQGDWGRGDRIQGSLNGESFGDGVAIDGARAAISSTDLFDPGFVKVYESVDVSPVLSVSGSCPGTLVLRTEGVAPNGRVGLYGAAAPGEGPFKAGKCAGIASGLSDPAPLRQEFSERGSQAELVRRVDESWCGSYIQILDERTCLTGPLVQVPELD